MIALAGEVAAAGVVAAWLSGSALMAFCCAANVVAATGHPFPGPFRFWRVIEAAVNRADWEFLELSSGKETLTTVLYDSDK